MVHTAYVHVHDDGTQPQYQATCLCGWAGIVWFDQANAARDAARHKERADDLERRTLAQGGE